MPLHDVDVFSSVKELEYPDNEENKAEYCRAEDDYKLLPGVAEDA